MAHAAGSNRQRAPSFDTVVLRHLCAAPCLDRFRIIRDETGERYVYNRKPEGGRALPQLTYSRDPTGRGHLFARVSIPKMLYGNNIESVTPEDIERGLHKISGFTSRVAGVEFDARTASVRRLDVCHTWQVGEDNVHRYLRALSIASLPRMQRYLYNGGLDWRNKTQKVVVYSKLAETLHRQSLGQATEEEVKAARGHLRIEVQFLTSGSCARLAKNRLKLPDRRAAYLLRPQVAECVIREVLAKLGLDQPIPTAADRVRLLRDFYGTGLTFSRLCRFAKAVEEHGEETVRRSVSYEVFHRTRAEIQAARAWLVNASDETLSPLLIETPAAARAAASTGRG